ncbi:hypothetical protein SNE40_019527 [Patella caerulea]|uniref:Uncharacterized protein n=1 Tax=Patella caerulea TaxID=87958 RepID=A0AAN8J7K4_PATCE
MMSSQLRVFAVLILVTIATARNCIYYKTSKRYANGSTFQLPDGGRCITYKCFNGAIRPDNVECYNKPDEKCYPVGTVLTSKCITHKCVYRIKAGFKRIKTQCSDKDGNCHDPGEIFPLQIKNTTYDSCQCQILEETNQISYRCTSIKAN